MAARKHVWNNVVAIIGVTCAAAASAGPNGLNKDEALSINQSISSPDKQFSLIMQGDGNLVLYGLNHRARWASNTGGRGGVQAIMQGDGNLVVYDSSHRALWSSGTGGHPLAWLVVSNTGNVVIYDSYDSMIWSTNVFSGLGGLGAMFGSSGGPSPCPAGTYLCNNTCSPRPCGTQEVHIPLPNTCLGQPRCGSTCYFPATQTCVNGVPCKIGHAVCRATLTFKTNDDDKDHDTCLSASVITFDGSVASLAQFNGTEVARIEESNCSADGVDRFPDHTTSTVLLRPRRIDLSAFKEREFITKVWQRTNGNDTWKFDVDIDILLSDGTRIQHGRKGVALKNSGASVKF